jgi:hypothetical protein
MGMLTFGELTLRNYAKSTGFKNFNLTIIYNKKATLISPKLSKLTK